MAAAAPEWRLARAPLPQTYAKTIVFCIFLHMIRVVNSLQQFVDDRLFRGRDYFDRDEALVALGLNSASLSAALTRLVRKRKLANPRHGFYLILRPEDQSFGAPDPARWIDPLMRHHGLDYRISLLRAAAFHGSSHQAAMVFQVIAPRQLRDVDIGRHRLQFLYQAPKMFAQANQPDWLDRIKSHSGFAQVAGVELTLLDCMRYMHRATGLHGVAQITKDIGAKASPRVLAKAASVYENSCVRRLGYLLDLAGHRQQANALKAFAARAKSAVLLDPSITPLASSLEGPFEKNFKWKIAVNERVEMDA